MWQAVDILNNQPNGVRIGCGRYHSQNPDNTPFHHLSRTQQVQSLQQLIEDGVDEIELKTELYLVSHFTLDQVRESFLYLI